MVKKTYKAIGSSALALFLVMLFFLAWILGTESGTRFLLASVSRLSSADFQIDDLEGRLLDELRLRGVKVLWPQGQAQVDFLRLEWNPSGLLRGHLDIAELAVDGIDLHLEETEKEKDSGGRGVKDLAFPRIPWAVRSIEADVASLKVRDLAVRSPGAEPWRMERLDANLSWRDGAVALDRVQAETSSGLLSGEARADFVSPALSWDLLAVPPEPAGELERFTSRGNLKPARGERRLVGPVTVTGWEKKEKGLLVEGEVDWAQDRLALTFLRLVRPGGPGEVAGSAEALLDQGKLAFTAELTARNLDLSPFTGFRTDLAGAFSLQGTAEKYQGQIALANRVESWQAFRLDSPFTGDLKGISLSRLEGEWLTGKVLGTLSTAWSGIPSVKLDLRAQGLDPSRLAPDWKGSINLEVHASGKFPEGSPTAEIEGRLLESRLRGRPLHGEIAAALEGEEVRIATLELHGEGFDISASGRLSEQVAFQVEVPRLDGLVPGGAGRIKAGGWVRWREDYLTGAVDARGGGIRIGKNRVRTFTLTARHEQKNRPFIIRAEAQGLAAGEVLLNTALLRAKGTVEDHSVTVSAQGPGLEFQAEGAGGYRNQSWSGELLALRVRETDFGRWTLQAPVPTVVAKDRFRVEGLRLEGAGGASLRAAADLTLEPRQGFVESSWNELKLEWLNRWLTGVKISGRSSGDGQVRWLPGDTMEMAAHLNASGVIREKGGQVKIPALEANLAWNGSGLEARWSLALEREGRFSGRIASDQPATLGLPEGGEIAADWNNLDLALFSSWLPDLRLGGESSGEFTSQWREGEILALRSHLSLSGWVSYEDFDLRAEKASADLLWGSEGLSAQWNVSLQGRGHLEGTLSSHRPIEPGLPEEGELTAQWRDLDPVLLSPWLETVRISGSSGGTVVGRWWPDRRLEIEAKADFAGLLQSDELRLEVPEARADLAWNEKGLQASWGVAAEGGRVSGRLISSEPARLEMPQRGEFTARFQDFSLGLLRPWMPDDLLLSGNLAGEMEGEWLPGMDLRMTGQAGIEGGRVQWMGEEGEIGADLKEVSLSWDWKGESLSGRMKLALEEYGRAEGEFRIPLPASLPTRIVESGPIEARLSASLREEGLLTSFFPGLVQETRGRVNIDLQVGGSWTRPDLGGSFQLTEAAAYLPAAGIHLEKIALQARLAGSEIRIESLQVHSGPGEIQGEGVLRFDGRTFAGYEGKITGERFQVIRLPELQVQASPALTFEGTRQKLSVRGKILVPELLIYGRDAPSPVPRSEDVIIVDAPVKEERELPLDLDILVQVVLGDRVLVQAKGVDAKLDGSLRIHVQSLEQITAQGEIKVVKGAYAAYGVNLKITRGNIIFAGGPIDRPTLDILALRTVGEVRAGVQVTGTPRSPVVKLYSEPAMPDTDVLAYIVLGHPLGSDGQNVGLLMLAAGSLLSKGESVVLQDRLQRRLGLDVLEIQSGEGDVTGSMITIGKYLSPELYISYGKSLFTEAQEARLRYDLTENVQLESKVGEESGVDLYYKIEFD